MKKRVDRIYLKCNGLMDFVVRDQLFGRLLNACISTKQIIKSPEVSA
jgi:hypothetical protein